jgi:hypothetical protein
MKYLYFDGGSNNALNIPVTRLLSMDQTGDTNIRMTFEHKDGTTNARTTVDLTINSGKEREVLKHLTQLAHGTGANFAIVADSPNNYFTHPEITAVSVDDGGSNGNGLTAGAGITAAAELYRSSVERNGNMVKTTILIDLTGLRSTAAGDIIGDDGTSDPCHIGQITAAQNGTIVAGKITCFEAPVGGASDIDIFAATDGTGAEDTAISGLTGQSQLVNAGVHTLGSEDALTAFPAADSYLYLVAGTTSDADYSEGKFLIELYGYI